VPPCWGFVPPKSALCRRAPRGSFANGLHQGKQQGTEPADRSHRPRIKPLQPQLNLGEGSFAKGWHQDR
jgi:hypothetical protein